MSILQFPTKKPEETRVRPSGNAQGSGCDFFKFLGGKDVVRGPVSDLGDQKPVIAINERLEQFPELGWKSMGNAR